MDQAPERLIDERGWPRLGIFPGPVGEVNHRDARLLTPMGRPRSALARRFAVKQFQFLGILCEEVIFGCALIDIGYIGGAFYYLYHLPTGTFLHRSPRTPLGLGLHMEARPDKSRDRFAFLGESVEMSSLEGAPGQRLVARFKAKGGEVKIDATLHEDAPPQTPMALCTRIGAAGWAYAQKTAGVRVSGHLSWPGGEVELAKAGAMGHRDWTLGVLRRETWWNWGCIATRLPDGRAVGLNISCGVNETGVTENCYWVDGALHKVDVVTFDYDREDLNRPWHMTSSDGEIDLRFTPMGRHVEHINAGLVASNFQQLFGRYHGRLGRGAGAITLDGALGFAEDHFARW